MGRHPLRNGIDGVLDDVVIGRPRIIFDVPLDGPSFTMINCIFEFLNPISGAVKFCL